MKEAIRGVLRWQAEEVGFCFRAGPGWELRYAFSATEGIGEGSIYGPQRWVVRRIQAGTRRCRHVGVSRVSVCVCVCVCVLVREFGQSVLHNFGGGWWCFRGVTPAEGAGDTLRSKPSLERCQPPSIGCSAPLTSKKREGQQQCRLRRFDHHKPFGASCGKPVGKRCRRCPARCPCLIAHTLFLVGLVSLQGPFTRRHINFRRYDGLLRSQVTLRSSKLSLVKSPHTLASALLPTIGILQSVGLSRIDCVERQRMEEPLERKC